MAGNKPEEQEKEAEKSSESTEAPELLIKHPLHNTWSLWYYENDRKKVWTQNLKEITSFDTVEDFWSVYNHIKAASELKQGCDYSVFKKGIRPMWEDAANKQGGRWLISLEKKQRGSELDNYWLEIILLMIGEAFEECSDEVCGATVNIRPKMDKIGLWTANADSSKKDVVLAIGKKIKERLKIASNLPIHYQLHSDSAVKNSVIKSTYTI